MRIFFYRLRHFLIRSKRKRIIGAVLALFMLCPIFLFCDSFFSPTVYALAETAVKGKASEHIHNGVGKIFSEVKFEDIYTVSKGNTGEITGIFLDSLEVNRLKSAIVKEVSEAINGLDTTVEIPMGNIFNNLFLGGRGKRVSVKVISVGAVESEIVNKIEDSGVNQTHLSSYMNIKAEVTARVGRKNIEVATVCDVLLCESVIVGKVPDSFVSINVMDEETLKWLNSYK